MLVKNAENYINRFGNIETEVEYPVKQDASLPCLTCIHFCVRFDITHCNRKNIENQREAIKNMEWHHVSLTTLANLDFDMLDEKRQRYFTVYRELQETLTRLRKCKTLESYDNCLTRLMRRKNVMWARGEISNAMWHFIEAKLSMQNVESGVWGSYNEKATGYHKSRRYNKSRA